MEKSIKNTDAIARKLRPTLTKATNYRLEVAREEIVERRKTEAMAAKYWRAGEEISLSSKEKKNDENDTRDETNPDQANNKYLLQLWEARKEKLQVTKVIYSFIHSSSIYETIKTT